MEQRDTMEVEPVVSDSTKSSNNNNADTPAVSLEAIGGQLIQQGAEGVSLRRKWF